MLLQGRFFLMGSCILCLQFHFLVWLKTRSNMREWSSPLILVFSVTFWDRKYLVVNLVVFIPGLFLCYVSLILLLKFPTDMSLRFVCKVFSVNLYSSLPQALMWAGSYTSAAIVSLSTDLISTAVNFTGSCNDTSLTCNSIFVDIITLHVVVFLWGNPLFPKVLIEVCQHFHTWSINIHFSSFFLHVYFTLLVSVCVPLPLL